MGVPEFCERSSKSVKSEEGRQEPQFIAVPSEKGVKEAGAQDWHLKGDRRLAHACNPSYSGGRDQDCGPKPAQFARPHLEKNTLRKRAGEGAQGRGPEFNPSTGKKNKQQQKKKNRATKTYKK
jgi:hypothetical protein